MTLAAGGASIVRLFHVSKRYGAKNALHDVSLDIAHNEFVFISGPSGAGKSTLLKLLYRAEPVSEGQILIDGINLARVASKRLYLLRRKFGIIFQDFKLIPTKSIFDNVALVLEAQGQSHQLIRKKVDSVLRIVGMTDRAKSLPPRLSGGEQQRVAVARAVVGDPAIILADEPTGSLDQQAADAIIALLRRFHRRGATVIVASHDKEMIHSVGGRVILLHQGHLQSEIVLEGNADAYGY